MTAYEDDLYIPGDVAALSGGENVLLLAASPGDETRVCGGFVAESCARGRPPYVAILTDGAPAGDAAMQARVAAAHAAAVRGALAALGLPEDRLLFVGIFDGAAPCDGPILEAAAAGIALVSWREDCNAICVPAPAVPGAAFASALAIACQVAADQRLRLFQALAAPHLTASPAAARMKLDVSVHRTRLDRAMTCLDGRPPAERGRFEYFLQDRDLRAERG